jgi:branched-chain amino acid transport system substrate-binding protein
MRQQGDPLKYPIVGVGYGGDLRSAGPAAEQDAQGAYFPLTYEPVELHTAATQRFVQSMAKYAGVSAEQITVNQYHAYASVDAFVTGLKAAGANPTQAHFIDAMLGIRSYNAAGLYGSHSIGFALDQRGQGASGADNCLWVSQWSGSTFHPVSGADPICGTLVPGKTVPASS